MGKESWRDKIGRGRSYNTRDFPDRDDVVLWDVVEIAPEQLIKITFVSRNAPNHQGIRLAVDAGKGSVETNGVSARGMKLWEHTSPREVICKCISPEGLLSVYNIYESNSGQAMSQMYGSGMLIEETGNITTYRCNDVGIQTNFDKLVFTLEKLPPQ